jgi:hypothetical protein
VLLHDRKKWRINTRMKEDKPNKLGMALLSKAVRDNVIS